MFNIMQKALIRKEVRGVVKTRGFFTNYLLVPLIMALVLPLGMVLVIGVFGVDVAEFEELFQMLQITLGDSQPEMVMINVVMDTVMPMLFLMIPPLIVTAMAAGSFTGEKERRTLETLLYTPMSLKEIFTAKVAATLFVGVFVTVVSFLIMMVSVIGLTFATLGQWYIPDVIWIVYIGIIAPAFAFLGIIIQVRVSAKAKSSEEAYQRGGVVVLPLLLVLVSQITGFMMIGPIGFLILGALLIGIGWILMRGTFKKISYESLLR